MHRSLASWAFACGILLLCEEVAAEPSPLLLQRARAGEEETTETEEPALANDPATSAPPPDALFPGRWRGAVSLASGIPFAVVGELTLGTSDDFALGVIGGLASTGDEYAVGGRLRLRVLELGPVDLAAVLPVLWYPPVEKREGASWLLTNPSLLLRGRPSEDWLVYGGVGAVLAACAADIGAVFSGEAAHHDDGADDEMVNGAWHTFSAGVSVVVYDDVAVMLDTMVMMTNFVPSKSYAEAVGPPVLATLGANYTF